MSQSSPWIWQALTWPLRELRLMYLVTASNLDSVLASALILAAGAIWNEPRPDWTVLGRVLTISTLEVLVFDIGGQLTGMAEDSLNKPHRPLLTGHVSPARARWRYALWMLALLALSYRWGVLAYATAWIGLCIAYNHCGGSRDAGGVLKNALAGVGIYVQLVVAWRVVTVPAEGRLAVMRWLLLLWTVGLAVQDFRDVDGDLAAGRRTLPILLGDARARLVMTTVVAGAAVLWPVGLAVWYPPADQRPGLGLLALGQSAWLGFVAYRVWTCRTRRQDRVTYRLYAAWLVLCLPMVTFGGPPLRPDDRIFVATDGLTETAPGS